MQHRKRSLRLLPVLHMVYCVSTASPQTAKLFSLTFDPDVRHPHTSPRDPSPTRFPLAGIATSLYRTSSAVSLPDVCRAQSLLHGSLSLLGTSPVTRRLLSPAEFSMPQQQQKRVLDAPRGSSPPGVGALCSKLKPGVEGIFSSVSPEHFVGKQKQMMINGGSLTCSRLTRSFFRFNCLFTSRH